MKQLVIMPGGFHPFHPGHLALYQSAQQAFPGADVKVAATNDTSTRPFPFKLKEKIAQLAGVPAGDFYQVKSPFRADEITRNYDPATTQLIFVRSKKDSAIPPIPGGIKRDGNPAYLQPISRDMAPMTQHAYMAYLPVKKFGPGMTGASDIRAEWPTLDQDGKIDRVMSLYPRAEKNPKLAKTVVDMWDEAMGTELTEVLDTKAGKSNHAHWNASDPDMVKFTFTASNGVEYQLDFLEPYIGPDEMSPYDFFDSDEVYNKSKFVSFEQLTKDIKGGYPVAKQGIEGTGSAAEVFGIVVNAIIQYVKKARPALLYFQAAEPNRRALYARMIRRILPGLPGWASTADDAGQFAIYNRRAIKSAMGTQVAEATGDERFDRIMSRIRQEPTIPDPQMPPTDVKDLYHWAVKHHKPYHKIFAKWANREGYKSVAPALQKAGNLDSDALDYWTPDVWKIWYGPDAEMPHHWSKERVPDELRDYLETVFDAYENIWQDWPNEYRQIGDQGMAEGSGGNWYIRVNGKILNDTKFKPVIFSSEGEARSHAMKLADKKRIPLSQIKLTKSWMDAPEQGVDEEVTRQMSQGGLRASYQDKYNQPMMEDYLDEARS